MNERKFDGKGAVYAVSRPSYPTSMFDALCEKGVLSEDMTAADIGAGTGIFTRLLSQYVRRVYAVEPNEEMRLAAEIGGSNDNVTFVDGNAERTSLPDGSVDVITAAQAFHWFDASAFSAECKRIFNKNRSNRVVLVWNDRDTSDGLIRANFEVNREFCPNFKGSSNGADIDGGVFGFFGGKFELLTFENTVMYGEDAFLQRNFSSSYAPKKGDGTFEPYSSALKEVFRRFAENGFIKYPYVTKCYIGKP